ncbi:uncharacterized protein A1O9_11919 [Exophiala aquamarina CBS 119918]|uniref:Myb-like domain-containing protein n=1 Tax=Exophiala aquamarina CBS 119918 TaxID=1182545 RepID=A0A072NVN5_9EURO|nr:uncharacterized protein A1O9_11919 [Exophiala aquamarina CBS 119918]KEF51929.1 hypothetical protein A1O9_11919 [Exophiala aquamarina CBS 119918]
MLSPKRPAPQGPKFNKLSPGTTVPSGSQANLSIPALRTEYPAKKRSRTNTPWTHQEEQRLKQMRDAGHGWSEIAKAFPSRTGGSIKKHWYKDMHYAEFAEDESDAIRAAIKEYEANKWKAIGQKLGKPAKACEQYANKHFKTDYKAFELDGKEPTSAKITRETKDYISPFDHQSVFEPVNIKTAPLGGVEDIHPGGRAESTVNSGVLNVPFMKSQDQLSPQLHIERSNFSPILVPLPLSPTVSMSGLHHSSHSQSEISFTGTSMTSGSLFFAMDEPHGHTMTFIEELASKVVRRSLTIAGRQGLRTHASSATDTKALPTRRTGQSKRAVHDRDERDSPSDDEEGAADGGPHPKRKRRSPEKSARLFACPFAKFDPERYSERNIIEKNYRKCSSKYLRDIARLKQHLYRTHQRPEWYCGNCYQNFDSREQLNEHNRERPPCDRSTARYEEMMTDNQLKEIKRRSPENSQHQMWYKIFQLLFPDAPRPISPYVSTCDPETVQHFVRVFQLVGPQELFQMMQARREHGPGSVQIGVSTQAIVDEAFEIALPDYLELLERDRRPQYVPVDVPEPSGRQSQDHRSDSSFSQETDNLTIATHAINGQLLQMPQATQGDAGSMPKLDRIAQPVLDISQTLPSDITELFDPFETLFDNPNVQIFEHTNISDDVWPQVNV